MTELDIEYSELKVTLSKVLAANQQLQKLLADSEKSLADLKASVLATNGEREVFRRQSAGLQLRLEALGLEGATGNEQKLQQRLLSAVGDLRLVTLEKEKTAEAMKRLIDSSELFAKSVQEAPPETRVALEASLRSAKALLGVSSATAREATAISPTVVDGMIISVKDELSLVVLNMGEREGVKVGMPFEVRRQDSKIATLQVVDVREQISGAVIQSLSSDKAQVAVGDVVKVHTEQ